MCPNRESRIPEHHPEGPHQIHYFSAVQAWAQPQGQHLLFLQAHTHTQIMYSREWNIKDVADHPKSLDGN